MRRGRSRRLQRDLPSSVRRPVCGRRRVAHALLRRHDDPGRQGVVLDHQSRDDHGRPEGRVARGRGDHPDSHCGRRGIGAPGDLLDPQEDRGGRPGCLNGVRLRVHVPRRGLRGSRCGHRGFENAGGDDPLGGRVRYPREGSHRGRVGRVHGRGRRIRADRQGCSDPDEQGRRLGGLDRRDEHLPREAGGADPLRA